MAQIHVKCTAIWQSVEPDGSECFHCGDQCLLSMYRLFVRVGNRLPRETEAVLCNSCRAWRYLDDDEFSE